MLPSEYLNSMKDLLDDEYDDYLASFNKPSVKGLRVNTSKISINDFLNAFPYELEKVPWCSDGFYYNDDSISKHPFYYAGLFYLQEPSAMLPAEILPIENGDIVLDCCAAPGGKSLKLLNKLNNKGLLVANDISNSRAKALLRNIERWGFENYFVTSDDTSKLAKKYPQTFDKILLDAPCSGEGMFRKDSSLIKSWLEKNGDYYSTIQKELIDETVSMLKGGGLLLYSTCTFSYKEDEDVIKYALNKYDDLKLEPIKMYEGFKQGLDGIGVKLFPHRIKGEGHFVCLLRKGNSQNKKEHIKEEINCDFLPDVNKKFYNGHFETINDNVYFDPNFDVSGIRTLRSGLLLGQMDKYGFKYAQAFAMALKKDEFKNYVSLSIGDNNLLKYLKGETINIDSNINGDVLVCLDSYPIGFGKLNNHQLKNKIDKGWTIK